MDPRTVLRRSAIPFLVLAEPVAFFLYQGGAYCEPLCIQSTLSGMGTLGVVLVGAWALAAGVTTLIAQTRGVDGQWPDRFTNPRRPTLAVVFGVFGAFLVSLTLDAMSVPGVLWKPIALPLSVMPFLPVWALYAATYPVAIAAGLFGFEISPAATLLFRGVVLFVGFGLAAIWQAVLATVVVETIWPR